MGKTVALVKKQDEPQQALAPVSPIVNQTNELATARAAAFEQHEIQSAITMAKGMPRNEIEAFNRLIKSCERPSMAEAATYSFPRGGTTVEGPSIKIAQEAARIWGNIRYGLDVVREDDDTRLLRGWAWDLETNTKVTADDLVEKIIERKFVKQGESVIRERTNNKGEVLKLIVPDERDLRELQNRRGAFLIRNCLLKLLPPDMIDAALDKSAQTLEDDSIKNIEQSRAKIVQTFLVFRVSKEMLENKVGHALDLFTPTDIKTLRQIYNSIKDGNSKVEDEFATSDTPEKAKGSLSSLAKPGTTENRGHGQDGLSSLVGKKEEPNSMFD